MKKILIILLLLPLLATAQNTFKANIIDEKTKGEIVFQKSCGSCHKMYGNGGNIGPELTGSNRANLDYFLFNVLNPSGEIKTTIN
jgi:cytochrome c2